MGKIVRIEKVTDVHYIVFFENGDATLARIKRGKMEDLLEFMWDLKC